MLENIKELAVNGENTDFTVKENALNELLNLLDKHELSGFDIEPDGLNMIIDYDTIHDIRYNQVKQDPDNFPALQDLERIDSTNSNLDPYFYINGYDRVEHVTADDIVCEFDDLKDYLNDNN